jgi:hypothetical protein
MRVVTRSLLLGCIALAFGVAPARATTGTLRLAWNACSASPIDLTVSPGQTSNIRLVASLSGQSDPSLAYEVFVSYSDANHVVPDAWRFDPAGCQGGALAVINPFAPAALSKTCPSFAFAGDPTLQSVPISAVELAPPPSGLPVTAMLIGFANAMNRANAPSPGVTYFVMDVEFDESMGANGPSVPGTTCGGLEDGICFSVFRANTLLSDGVTELPFPIATNGGMLTANAPGGGCLTTAAHPATWGSVKAQYHN